MDQNVVFIHHEIVFIQEKDGMLPSVATGAEPEDVILGEVNQAQKGKYYIISPTRGNLKSPTCPVFWGHHERPAGHWGAAQAGACAEDQGLPGSLGLQHDCLHNTCQGRPAGGRSTGNNLLPEPGSCFPLNCKQEVH